MLWDTELIAKLLRLYKENRLLWDHKHHNYSNITLRHETLQGIKDELAIPISPPDIHRKYKTMRAAYQVEMRNINAAKLRGFFYKPTLHWFEMFHQFMEDINDIKEKEDKASVLQNISYSVVEVKRDRSPHRETYMPIRNENDSSIKRRVANRRQKAPAVQIKMDPESSEEEECSEESEDEFQTFADHIAEQLRTLSVHRAVMIQNQIQRLFAKDREINGEDEE